MLSTSTEMTKEPMRHRRCSFGVALVVVTLLVPKAHVPPAWWQGGWPRHHVGSAEEVELLSPLAAMLMPKTFVCELFRNFPSIEGEKDLEPSFTAYGIMKDPNAALFVHYDEKHGRREGLNDDFRKQLLAYGPPGSHVLHISHTDSRPLEDMVLSLKVGAWHPGDEASLSHVLTGICTQVSLALGDVMCPEVLERLHSKKVSQNTSDLHDFRKFCVALRGAAVKQESLEHRLFAEGFSPASVKRMLKSAYLSGKFVKEKLESRMQWLLNLGQSRSQIRDIVATSSPVLGNTLQKNLKPAVQWFSNQVGKAFAIRSIFCSNSLQTLQATVFWLLDLGLSHRQVLKVVGCCPEVLDAGKPNMEWFLKVGMNKNQIRKAACALPMILGCSVQEDFMPKLDLLLALGLSKNQVAKLIATSPHILACSTEEALKSKVKWLFELGMTRGQVVKVIAASQVLGCSLEKNLKPKVEWFFQLGMTQGQIVKLIAAFPAVLHCSVKNLKLKVEWFSFQLGMLPCEIIKAVAVFPQFFCCSIERNLKPKVEWFFQLGIQQDRIAKLIASFPQVLGSSTEKTLKPKVEWFFQLGIRQGQVAKLIAAFPQVLCCIIEKNLKPKVEWFFQLGMPHSQVAKLIAAFPRTLCYSVEQNLKPKVKYFFQLGMTQNQVVKMIAAFPPVLGRSIVKNLQPKVEWLSDLGMSQPEIVKVIVVFPQILSLSIEKNLVPKRALLQEVLGARGVLDVVLRGPQIMGMSYLRLSTRLMILVKSNETTKLVTAMKMTRESFKSRFLDDL